MSASALTAASGSKRAGAQAGEVGELRRLQRATRIVLWATLAGLLAGALAWLSQRPLFDIRRIELVGALQHVPASAVRTALAGQMNGNWFTLPLADARQRLLAIPWVAKASIRRIWPDRLQVELVEHRALGVWDDGRLLSDRGVLFAANPAEAEVDGPLPEFSGPPRVAAEMAQRYPQLLAQWRALGLSVTSVEVSERGAWTLHALTADGPATRFELGRDTADAPIAERIDALVAAYPIVVARMGGPPQRIDARYLNGLTALPAPNR